MKTGSLFILLIILGGTLRLQGSNDMPGQKGAYDYGRFRTNAQVFLFADSVNVREKPAADSALLETLPLGTPVRIRETPEIQFIWKGIKSYWYGVSFKDSKGKERSGYIWGGFLSLAGIRSDLDKDGEKELLLIGIAGRTKDKAKDFAVRLVKNGKTVQELHFKPIDTDLYMEFFAYSLDAELLEKKGFSPALKFIRIGFTYEACDYNNGDVLLLWDGKELRYGLEAVRVSNEFAYCVYEYIFPGDRKGKKNILTVRYETGEHDEKGNVKNKNRFAETYLWDGREMKKE